jgi:hypothetical protein
MLYDPKWDEPSMEGFLRFCESRPPEEEYWWVDGVNCACGQYYQFLGRKSEWLNRFRLSFGHLTWQLDKVAGGTWPHTFGALAAALRERLHDHSQSFDQ